MERRGARRSSLGRRRGSDQVGCSHDEVRYVLSHINELNHRLEHAQNWFHHRQLDEATFELMLEEIDK